MLLPPIPPLTLTRPTWIEIEHELNKRVIPFGLIGIWYKSDKKHNINLLDFDEMSFDNAEESAFCGKLKTLPQNTPEYKK